MVSRLSLRGKLTLWYTAISLAALLAFSGSVYLSVKGGIYASLDLSLKQDAEYIHRLLQTKITPHRPLPKLKKLERKRLKEQIAREGEQDSTLIETPEEREAMEVWADVYRHVLLNPKSNLVQAQNDRGDIVFRSDNLLPDSLAIPQTPRGISLHDTTLADRGALRVAVLNGTDMDIAVAYPLEEINAILNQLFAVILYLLPVILLVSAAGGWLLARASLRPVGQTVATAREITGHNLDQRIPVPQTGDEMHELVETLNAMIDRLQKAFAQVREFTADASHELRTPLTILTGELELALRTPQTPERYQRLVSSALDEVLRLSSIVNKLLLLSRAEAGQLELHREEVHLRPMLEEILEDAEVLAAPKNIAVRFAAPEDVVVAGDSARLHELFLNLVDNAIKYSNPDGLLAVALERSDGQAVVRVRDTGIGIAPEDLAKVFVRFYRVDKARSRAAGGSGLGLAIARWIAEAHHGTLTVTSELGSGSEFCVRLPVQESPA